MQICWLFHFKHNMFGLKCVDYIFVYQICEYINFSSYVAIKILRKVLRFKYESKRKYIL